MSLYDDIAARLNPDRCPAVLQAVSGIDGEKAMELIALAAVAVSAVVVHLSEAASPVRESGFQVSQADTVTFGVLLGLVFPGGYPEFEAACAQIKAALAGWTPDGMARPVYYAGGATLRYDLSKDGGRWLYLLRFTTRRQNLIGAQQ